MPASWLNTIYAAFQQHFVLICLWNRAGSPPLVLLMPAAIRIPAQTGVTDQA
jgi:hypothetical protein